MQLLPASDQRIIYIAVYVQYKPYYSIFMALFGSTICYETA